MKAVAISVRVADFLKQYPPFQFMRMQELVGMAEQGRVKFHEGGETIFLQGQPRDQWIYVVQQGKVRVVEQSGESERLVDYRGAGDLLGLQGIRSEEPYLHTAETEQETILYALPRGKFVELAEKNPEARRYLAAYFTLNPVFSEGIGVEGQALVNESVTLRKGGLWEVEPPQAIARRSFVAVGPETPLLEVAALLQGRRTECVLIVDGAGRPMGKLSDADLRDRFVEGSLLGAATAGEVMYEDLVAASPDENTGQLLIKLARHGKQFLVITTDGTLGGKAVGLIGERHLFLQYGRFPTVIGEAIQAAPDVEALRRLRDRMEALILEFLEDRGALSWLMEMAGILNRKLVGRLISLSQKRMAEEGLGAAPVEFEWLLMGSGGRDELLIRSAVYHALVYAEPREGTGSEVAAYFKELAQRVAAGLRQCGFMESEQGILAQTPGWCLPLGEMLCRYSNMVRDPEAYHVYSARDAFDFCVVGEEGSRIARALRSVLHKEIVGNTAFIRHMARDSLLNQPPRTIFQGYVVDGKGIEREELAIKFHAILPMVDIGRVLALEAGDLEISSTSGRLLRAAERAEAAGEGSAAKLLRDLADAFMVAQYARVSRGLRAGTDGAVIRPANLDAQTRTLLVTAFRTILLGLEYIAGRYGLELRI